MPGATPAIELLSQTSTVAPPPRPRTPLVGRERELALAEDLLRRAEVGLLTLSGARGSGKTRLALAIAARQRGYFTDGTAWVPLALVATPEQVLTAIATAIGVREIPGEPLEGTLARVLADRVILLVLDNFEHVLAAGPSIGDLLLNCPGVKALVTSRAPLRISGEHELTLVPLELPPAATSSLLLSEIARVPSIQLWCQRIAAADPSSVLTAENAPVVAEICRRLDGLPLAIELAAARARILPPRILLDRLSHRLSVLIDGPRDLPARQQTLRSAIAWSHDLLQPLEQTLFRRLAVFPGGCALDAVAAVANVGHDVDDTLEPSLGGLLDHHLLIRLEAVDGEPRIGMLETIREFALERLAESGEMGRIRRAQAEYFARLAETGEPVLDSGGRQTWLRRLDAEQANVRSVLEWAIEQDAAENWFPDPRRSVAVVLAVFSRGAPLGNGPPRVAERGKSNACARQGAERSGDPGLG